MTQTPDRAEFERLLAAGTKTPWPAPAVLSGPVVRQDPERAIADMYLIHAAVNTLPSHLALLKLAEETCIFMLGSTTDGRVNQAQAKAQAFMDALRRESL